MKSSRWKISAVVVPGIVLACLWHPLVSTQSNNQGNDSGSATREINCQCPLGTGAAGLCPTGDGGKPGGNGNGTNGHATGFISGRKNVCPANAGRPCAGKAGAGSQSRQRLPPEVQPSRVGIVRLPDVPNAPGNHQDNGQTPARAVPRAGQGFRHTGNVDYRTDTTGSESGLA